MDTTPEIIQLTPGPAVAIRARIAFSELPGFFGSAFGELAACARDQVSGPPFAIYHSVDANGVDVEAAMPVRAPVAAQGRATPIVLAGGPAVQVRHIGPYEELHATYALLDNWIEAHHRAKAGPVRETYLTPPGVPPNEMVTIVVQPVQA
jgi:effector-binding domain-containing protein